ncbi:MAG: HD domain-containing protein [Nanoarchaeota archaeon]|jgi:response regulator RpfG family c-di-GMP phosphodiesterase|nr:HD domain-containing protein [Nanoarchaeota archaeon]
MISLEKEVNESFDRAGVFNGRRAYVASCLNELREYDEYKWGHSVRVGISAEKITNKYFSSFPVDKLMVASYLHDVGVLDVDVEVVAKADISNSNFTTEDYEKIKEHVVFGYEKIKEALPDEARIMLYHHMQSRGYPEVLPERTGHETLSEDDCRKYGRIIELCDFADSLNRHNGRFGELGLEGRKDILMKEFVEMPQVVDWAYREGVFR